MSKIYYRQAKAAIVCFDLTQRDTFQKVKFWVEELLQNEEQCSIYIVGTKFDLVQLNPTARAVSPEEVEAYAESVGCAGVFETSAKDNANIENLFQTIARGWLEKNKKPPGLSSSSTAPTALAVGTNSQAGAGADSGSCCR
eukprot:TRINITY_DN1634_c0_g1_i1.p1 TRINITY_DN1634_c0_g1~~TRINITY_DN1634_c0_g1_i1.p1  ORF type:complete len:141 (-),score=20.57 TRINITY_DN1634_c0_g1_i1:68-490(-)